MSLLDSNNPGSIRPLAGGQMWQGQIGVTEKASGKFCVFEDMPHGVRAMIRLWRTYQQKRLAKDGTEIDTVTDIVHRWAPPNENATSDYVNFVLKNTGIKRGTIVDSQDWEICLKLLRAFIIMEQGWLNGKCPVSDADLKAGMRLAGLKPPPKKDPVNVAGTGAVAATAGVAVVEVADVGEVVGVAERNLPFIERIMQLENLPAIIALVGIGVGAWLLYRHWRSR